MSCQNQAPLAAPQELSASVPCLCGQPAHYQRRCPATVTTILGPITFQRPYYLCAACGHGRQPLDAQLQLCAGSRSAGLDELLALLGASKYPSRSGSPTVANWAHTCCSKCAHR